MLTASSQAFYAEALGSPALEYMLVSNATRLAQSKGLHLACPEEINTPAGEALSRKWLWWVLYAYEKHVAYRSGRPSVSSQSLVFAPLSIPVGETFSRRLSYKRFSYGRLFYRRLSCWR